MMQQRSHRPRLPLAQMKMRRQQRRVDSSRRRGEMDGCSSGVEERGSGGELLASPDVPRCLSARSRARSILTAHQRASTRARGLSSLAAERAECEHAERVDTTSSSCNSRHTRTGVLHLLCSSVAARGRCSSTEAAVVRAPTRAPRSAQRLVTGRRTTRAREPGG
jgi:hypothetical protein